MPATQPLPATTVHMAATCGLEYGFWGADWGLATIQMYGRKHLPISLCSGLRGAREFESTAADDKAVAAAHDDSSLHPSAARCLSL
jgi:hypothetical protein